MASRWSRRSPLHGLQFLKLVGDLPVALFQQPEQGAEKICERFKNANFQASLRSRSSGWGFVFLIAATSITPVFPFALRIVLVGAGYESLDLVPRNH